MTDNIPVVVNVQLTPADLDDLWKSSPIRMLGWLLIAIALFSAYMVFAEVANEGFTPATSYIVIEYGLAASGGFFGGFFLLPLRVRQMFRSGPTLREPRRYSLSDREVRFDSELMTCDCRWGAFSNIRESRRSFLLYRSRFFSAFVIPKRCFSTSDDIGRLRDLFRSQFKGKLKLRG